jgi:hypothetical protein
MTPRPVTRLASAALAAFAVLLVLVGHAGPARATTDTTPVYGRDYTFTPSPQADGTVLLTWQRDGATTCDGISGRTITHLYASSEPTLEAFVTTPGDQAASCASAPGLTATWTATLTAEQYTAVRAVRVDESSGLEYADSIELTSPVPVTAALRFTGGKPCVLTSARDTGRTVRINLTRYAVVDIRYAGTCLSVTRDEDGVRWYQTRFGRQYPDKSVGLLDGELGTAGRGRVSMYIPRGPRTLTLSPFEASRAVTLTLRAR